MRLSNLLSRLSSRERTLLMIVLVLSTLLLGYFLLVQPQAHRARELRRALKLTEQRLQIRQQQLQQANALKQSRTNLQRTLQLVHERMFSPPDLHYLLKDLAREIEQAGGELVSIVPRTDSTSNESQTLLTVESLETRVRGSYRAIAEAVRRIERQPQFVSVDSILIETTSQRHLLQAVITLHVYSFNGSSDKATFLSEETRAPAS